MRYCYLFLFHDVHTSTLRSEIGALKHASFTTIRRYLGAKIHIISRTQTNFDTKTCCMHVLFEVRRVHFWVGCVHFLRGFILVFEGGLPVLWGVFPLKKRGKSREKARKRLN